MPNERPGPSFLATEWEEAIFERVKGQRARFRQLAANRWPEFSDELLSTLALSLAYEADSHTASYPNLDVLCFDQGREANEDDLNRYAEDRLALYASLIDENVNLRDPRTC
jgi:hypothetical protein